MNKHTILCLTLVVFGGCQEKGPDNFNGYRWGASPEDVPPVEQPLSCSVVSTEDNPELSTAYPSPLELMDCHDNVLFRGDELAYLEGFELESITYSFVCEERDINCRLSGGGYYLRGDFSVPEAERIVDVLSGMVNQKYDSDYSEDFDYSPTLNWYKFIVGGNIFISIYDGSLRSSSPEDPRETIEDLETRKISVHYSNYGITEDFLEFLSEKTLENSTNIRI